MSALISRVYRSPVAVRVRRFAAVLAAAGAGLLAWLAVVPAASAASMPYPFGNGGAGPALPARSVIHIVHGGMPGWQIAAIAVAAALVATAAAVFLDRAWSSRHAAHVA